MITVTCKNENCRWHDVGRNVLGDPPFVECGGCHVHLAPTDLRDDPPMPDMEGE